MADSIKKFLFATIQRVSMNHHHEIICIITSLDVARGERERERERERKREEERKKEDRLSDKISYNYFQGTNNLSHFMHTMPLLSPVSLRD